jgi:hypothetical protein
MTIYSMKKFHQKEQKHQNFTLAVPKEKGNIVFRLEHCLLSEQYNNKCQQFTYIRQKERRR